MRAAILLIAMNAAQAGVISRDWENGKLTLRLDDGGAEIEFAGETSFRYSRGIESRGAAAIVPAFEDTRSTLKLRGRFMTVEIDKASAGLRVSANDVTI